MPSWPNLTWIKSLWAVAPILSRAQNDKYVSNYMVC